MIISIGKEVMEAIQNKDGKEILKPFGWSDDAYRWKRGIDIDLSDLTKVRTQQLRSLLEKHKGLKAIKSRIEDIDRWLDVLDGEKVVCKKLKDFAPLLKQYLKTAPKHWLYGRREHSDIHQPYLVTDIKYHPPEVDRYGRRTPGCVAVVLFWEELGQYDKSVLNFYKEEVEGLTVGKALAEAGYSVESPAMLQEYEENKAFYSRIWDKVGLQFTAVGEAEEETKKESYWWCRHQTIKLDKDGVPSRVVVDVLSEEDKAESKKGKHPSGEFWKHEGCDFEGSESDDDDDLKPGDEDEDEKASGEELEVPLAPALMCFDLRRHTRLKIYVDQLTEYAYQKDLSTKLILPDEVRDLVDMLVSHRGGFKDIVGGKGGGAIILCAGPPGTGKTLTSEVYSEAMSRPLYSVQCSQLGTDPDELEQELLKTFSRAARWNAILLLDEADVYVAARGHDLVQNAIVGVFLRVLEYYSGVLFMTTNRADLVDDAVASRCLARIDYQIPTTANQVRIWRTLATTAGIPLPDREISEIVKTESRLSGRDIKNLLKLGSMVAAARGTPVTAEIIRQVKRFKPTGDTKE